jgi:hypothetical protein
MITRSLTPLLLHSSTSVTEYVHLRVVTLEFVLHLTTSATWKDSNSWLQILHHQFPLGKQLQPVIER